MEGRASRKRLVRELDFSNETDIVKRHAKKEDETLSVKLGSEFLIVDLGKARIPYNNRMITIFLIVVGESEVAIRMSRGCWLVLWSSLDVLSRPAPKWAWSLPYLSILGRSIPGTWMDMIGSCHAKLN